MIELVATIILLSSVIGVAVILFRKIPVLMELPEVPEKKPSIVLRLKGKIKEFNPFKNFSYEIFLQKILSKIRILTLKTENKTASWLQRLRKRAQKKREQKTDNYWEELKKSTKK